MQILVVTLAMLSNIFQLLFMMQGKVRTPRLSWIIWFIVIGLSFIVNLLFNGWETASMVLGTYTAGNGFIVLYILYTKQTGWTKRETNILKLIFVVMAFWVLFKVIEIESSFLWATIIAIILLRGVHFLGVLENWQKVWIDPHGESFIVWFLRLASSSLSCIYILNNKDDYISESNMFVSLGQQLYLAITVSVTIIVIAIRRKGFC